MSDDRLVAVLDIGKSNAKIILLDPSDGRELAVARRANRSPETAGVRMLDLEALQAWVPEILATLPDRSRIGAIVPVAHGAACVMLDASGRVLLAPDYEDPVFDEEAQAYGQRRDPFSVTLSPRLPQGLNLGRQIHFVQRRLPDLFDRITTILPLAQYWAWFLCGVAASEVTSLACHTDLWAPARGYFSPLAVNAGWAQLFAPRRAASDRLGPLRPELAARCGLPADCMVLCGIHDSNASWYRHRVSRRPDERFSVVSSGTWTVILSSGTPAEALQSDRDMLANVDATGALVGTARFMGGREYEAVTGREPPPPDAAALHRAIEAGALVRPCFAAGGQFIGRIGQILNSDGLDPSARSALATFYVALLTCNALDLLRASGEIIIDGPLAHNPLFAPLLASLREANPVLVGDGSAGSAGGALALLGLTREARPLPRAAPLTSARALRAVAANWRANWSRG